ncbi:hypothetical protein NEOLEDRAFT_1119019 [Neolentinus lepideus HHB14362 ss-1]|uniref:F-box domain-containing protein n=1 Tax=Neolentinus lepideus HHB14362 ss-1 TaxID=1314782 RepID=A0A165QPT4_9AGAM|nr:hypothetical protein NEOLEDRAFT_1119019 [Neolentinus lepideus HHB14362 ss-1]
MPCASLPAELWSYIFDVATEEPVLSDCSIPTAWDESIWFRTMFGEWALKPPHERVNEVQRKSYATKKAIVSTSKVWRQIGSEHLFKYIFIERPSQLRLLCELLDKDSSRGWWTKRFHLVRFFREDKAQGDKHASVDALEDHLISIIRNMPNLQIFGVKWPLGNSFGPVADALCTFCSHTLRTVHWSVSVSYLSRVIWALASLPNLGTVAIDFQIPTAPVRLGSASDLSLTLPNVAKLSLQNSFTEFVEQAAGWSMPSLVSVTLDSGAIVDGLPDIPMFLTAHGLSLTYLDLNIIPSIDTATILTLCPNLHTFSFNPDWPLETDPLDVDVARIVRQPHQHITHIGLHQLLHAFGVGYTGTMDTRQPFRANIYRRNNDLVFAALNQRNFPALRCVRVLNRGLLSDLERANGPGNGCFERWERWWSICSRQNVRLEDCTGGLLGNLPELEDEGEDEDGTETVLSEDSSQRGEEFEVINRSELRQLLNECRKMNATRSAPPTPVGRQVR